MKRPLIVGNWKMNTTLADAAILATTIKNNVANLEVDVVLCPPFIWLYPIWEIMEKSSKNIDLGAQNMWFAPKGAITGEISPLMLKSLVKYVILGHSERRSHFKEDDHLVNDKVLAALEHNLRPIVCVGEYKKMAVDKRGRGRPTLADEKSDMFTQLRIALTDVSKNDAEKIIVAYEPIWAISTNPNGEPATGAYAASIIGKLRDVLAKKYGNEIAERIPILYGGSVDSENINEFIHQPEIDGVLVGGASLRAKEFIKICKEAGGRD